MNRQERRQARKNLRGAPAYKKMTREQRLDELVKNGITPEYVDAEKEKSFKEGHFAGVSDAFITVYAAVAQALHNEFGFGRSRIKKVLSAADDITMTTLTEREAIKAVWDKIGLRIDVEEPFDRISEVDKDA